jgi:hypothetical protein
VVERLTNSVIDLGTDVSGFARAEQIIKPAVGWQEQNVFSVVWVEHPIAPQNIPVYPIAMDSESFQASRWSSGNHLFPVVIEVSDQAIIRRKRSWFSQDEISISLSKVASVHVKTGLIWANILIESSGGSDPLTSHGHSKTAARRIRELVEAAQGIGSERIKLS